MAIGWRTRQPKDDADPAALVRRLLLPYVAAFGAIFIVAGFVFRWAFVENLDRQTVARLQLLARAGLRSTLFVGDRLQIDKAEISNRRLLEEDQGLEWFDRQGRSLGSEGLVPNVTTPPREGYAEVESGGHTFKMVGVPVINPSTGARTGLIRAYEWNQHEVEDIRWLDTGLFVGTLLAIVGSGAGGLALAYRAVRPVARTFRTLREFTADASHELRGPLAAIATSADAALRAERNHVRDHERFESIADAANQMSRLTGDLLLLASADRSLERDTFVVDLDRLLRDLVNRYRPRFEAAGVQLQVSSDQSAVAYGNPAQIERMILNLVENALRYTPCGGVVSVEQTRDRTHLYVTVKDSGIGIAPQHLGRVFERFWRADPARPQGGFGLGLSIARELARRHGGEITVTSRVGAGSTFVATLPARPRRSG